MLATQNTLPQSESTTYTCDNCLIHSGAGSKIWEAACHYTPCTSQDIHLSGPPTVSLPVLPGSSLTELSLKIKSSLRLEVPCVLVLSWVRTGPRLARSLLVLLTLTHLSPSILSSQSSSSPQPPQLWGIATLCLSSKWFSGSPCPTWLTLRFRAERMGNPEQSILVLTQFSQRRCKYSTIFHCFFWYTSLLVSPFWYMIVQISILRW